MENKSSRYVKFSVCENGNLQVQMDLCPNVYEDLLCPRPLKLHASLWRTIVDAWET